MNVFFVVCNVDGLIAPATQRVWATEEEALAYAATVHPSYAPIACAATINAGMLWRNIPAPHGDSEEDCVLCGDSTAPGSGKWVNRVSYSGEDEDGNEVDGWSCAECLCIECDECGEPIPLDEDVVVDCWQGDVHRCGRYHEECHDSAKHGPAETYDDDDDYSDEQRYPLHKENI